MKVTSVNVVCVTGFRLIQVCSTYYYVRCAQPRLQIHGCESIACKAGNACIIDSQQSVPDLNELVLMKSSLLHRLWEEESTHSVRSFERT